MYSIEQEKEKPYVITYKELFFTFLVFSAILIVLYPKEMLKEQILAESSNYDLSMLYLKNLLVHSPKDETLMIILAKQSLLSGKKDLSLRLLQLLVQSKDKKIHKEATLLSYKLEKENYFYYQDSGQKKQQKKTLEKLTQLFELIYTEKIFDDIEYGYREATFVNNRGARHLFLKQKLQNEPFNITLLEEDYYLEKSLKHWKDAFKTLQLLQNLDIENKHKWILAEYYTYMDTKKYIEAENLLKRYSDTSTYFSTKLAKFYYMRKKYLKASQVYMQLFKNENNYSQKKNYFFKALEVLQGSDDMNQAAYLAHKHENYYLNDRFVRTKIVKLYVTVGRLDLAQKLSIKIMNRGFK